MRSTFKTLQVLVWLTQLGLSVVVPLAGFVLLGVWLHKSHAWGAWTVPVGIVLGLMGAVGGLYSSFQTLHRLQSGDKQQPPKGYNQHD